MTVHVSVRKSPRRSGANVDRALRRPVLRVDVVSPSSDTNTRLAIRGGVFVEPSFVISEVNVKTSPVSVDFSVSLTEMLIGSRALLGAAWRGRLSRAPHRAATRVTAGPISSTKAPVKAQSARDDEHNRGQNKRGRERSDKKVQIVAPRVLLDDDPLEKSRARGHRVDLRDQVAEPAAERNCVGASETTKMKNVTARLSRLDAEKMLTRDQVMQKPPQARFRPAEPRATRP